MDSACSSCCVMRFSLQLKTIIRMDPIAKPVLATIAARIAGSQRLEAYTLASIGDGVIVTGSEARITFMNHVAADLTGWPAEEAMGKTIADVFRIINET